MSRGIVATLQLAASLLFAVPVALFGVFNLLEGRPLVGVGFLVLAGLMVLFEELVTSPKDLPALVVEAVGSRVVKSPEKEE